MACEGSEDHTNGMTQSNKVLRLLIWYNALGGTKESESWPVYVNQLCGAVAVDPAALMSASG